jgi:hypothetical protein
MSKAYNKNDIVHILSLDHDDFQVDAYKKNFEDSIVIVNHNKSVVDATNNAAKLTEGGILIYLSDDFDCPKNWDLLVKNRLDETKFQLLKVDDLLQPFSAHVLTIPIMTYKLYKKLGYFFYPEYLSMWCDVDLFYTCRDFIIEAPELVFKHNHHSIRATEKDETYRRSESNWDQGLAVIRKRFPHLHLR